MDVGHHSRLFAFDDTLALMKRCHMEITLTSSVTDDCIIHMMIIVMIMGRLKRIEAAWYRCPGETPSK